METVKGFEKEHTRIDKKKQSLRNQIAKLEKVSNKYADLLQQEKDLKAQEKTLEKGQNALAKDKERVAKIEAKVQHAKELKMNIPMLEKKYAKFMDQVAQAEAKLMAVAPEALAKRELLKDMQTEIGSSRKELETKERLLTNREHIFKRQQEHFEEREEEALMEYMHETAEQEMGTLPIKTRYPEIQELLDQARASLNKGDANTAVRLAAEIDILIEKLKEVGEKRKLNYDLLELKTNIKLASLA